MLKKRLMILLAISLLAFSWTLTSVEPQTPPPLSKTVYPELGITELILTNGMRVCLKPTTFENDEILIRLTAKGGYATLPPAQRAAFELAPQVAWESGLEGLSTDKLTAMIYDHSIELNVQVRPYHRIIEGTTDSSGMEFFFDILKRYSMQKQFTQEGFNKVVQQSKLQLCARDGKRISSCEEWSKLVHAQDVATLKPLTLQDLDTMTFDRAKQFFEEYFSNPADFICVIVGHFDPEKIVTLINSYLGAIPRKEGASVHPPNNWPQFPEGTTIKRIPVSSAAESIASLTYPFTPIQKPELLYMAELVAQVVETRLRSVLDRRAICLTVALELPFYPSLSLTWLAVNYRAPAEKVEMIKNLVNAEIKKILAEGATAAEIATGWKLLQQKEKLWQKDNQYWLSILSDYFLRSWNWQGVHKMEELQTLPTTESFKQSMQTLMRADQFSFIYTYPAA